MIRRGAGPAAVLAVLVGLSGCSGTTGGAQPVHVVQTYRGTAVAQKGASFSDAHPVVVWLTGRRDVALTAYGSSGCPPVPDVMTVTSATRIALHLKEYHAVCTSDVAATTTEFALPSGVSRHRTVHVTLDEAGRTATTLRLAADVTVAAHQG